MRTRSQKLAEDVFKRMECYKERSETDKTEYGSMAHKLPILIHHAGLAQAVEFVRTREKQPHRDLLEDLSKTLELENSSKFAECCRKAELVEYIHLTQRALDALLWYKRFAKSVLGVEANEGGI